MMWASILPSSVEPTNLDLGARSRVESKMKKMLVCLLLYSLTITTFADVVSYSAARMVRVGTKVVQAGDNAEQVRKSADPDKITPVINKFGVKMGEQWLYDRGNGSFTVIMVNNYGIVYAVGDFIDR